MTDWMNSRDSPSASWRTGTNPRMSLWFDTSLIAWNTFALSVAVAVER